MPAEDWDALRSDAEQLFTPGTAIREQDLFDGRKEQIAKLSQRIRLAGSHAVIYGERGVGKSSLVNVFRYIADKAPSQVTYIRVAVTEGDDFRAVMLKVFKRLTILDGDKKIRLADAYEGKDITPDDVLLELDNIIESATPIIVIDEFDILKDEHSKKLVSNMIKLLSDEGANATFFIVGVSDSVGDLLRGHESIGRAISEIEMPRMSDQEIIDIIYNRLIRAGMKINSDALWECIFISKGLPHYAHLLGLHAMQAACERRTLRIEQKDVQIAMARSLAGANQSIKENFQQATYSERTDNIFRHVLAACALAQKDNLGKFNAKSVAVRLNEITGGSYDVPAFSYHLNEFCETSRGNILEKSGDRRKFTYRFRMALMEPYVLLECLAQGVIAKKHVLAFAPKRQSDLFST